MKVNCIDSMPYNLCDLFVSICRTAGGYKSGRRKNRSSAGDGSKVNILPLVVMFFHPGEVFMFTGM
jgi:hypothetical protein